MPIDENMIFKAIYERHGDKPIEYVMQEVAKAKASYIKAEMALANEATDITPQEPIEAEAKALPEGETVKKKRYTRRDFNGRSAKTAIKEESIMCCLCGREFKRLDRHLSTVHGIPADEYRVLCGYPSDQKLASFKDQRDSVENMQKIRASKAAKEPGAKNVAVTQSESLPAEPTSTDANQPESN